MKIKPLIPVVLAFLTGTSVLLMLFSTPAIYSSPTKTNTWTIVAMDPATGEVGVAGASCVPNTYIDVIAALVPGKGAGATQAEFSLAKRNEMFDLLKQGLAADPIIAQLTRDGAGSDSQQFGVVTGVAKTVQAAGFTGRRNLEWAGDRQDRTLGVSVQGNLIESEAVVVNALAAFKADVPSANLLSDRLMRALEAGSAAGGDRRCNSASVRQTASTAFILVARGQDAPYAATAMGITDAGIDRAPWLALSVKRAQFADNPLAELRHQYDAWRREHANAGVGSPSETTPGVPNAAATPATGIDMRVVGAIALVVAAIGFISLWMFRRQHGRQ